MSRLIVTITPPTPNGGLHLGHMAGPFLCADVYARAQRQRGHDVLLVCYSDDYQSYLARKARELGRTTADVSGQYAAEIADTLERADVKLDWFLRAWDNPHFLRCVAGHWRAVNAAGAIADAAQPVPYCAACDLLGYEAFARGACNHCGAPSDASQCEHCAAAPDATAMHDLHCTQCGAPTGWRAMPRKRFQIGAFRDALRRDHAASTSRAPLREFLQRTLDLPDLDWPVNRPQEHGIPVEHDGSVELISTWFSGLAGYQACLEEMSAATGRDVIDEFWRRPGTRLVHFLGFDCSFSHAIGYRAILHTLADAPRDAHYYTNAFLKLDGQDFSTSRGHAIWARDVLGRIDAGVLRRYLVRVAPEVAPANFDSAGFEAWVGPAQRECDVLLGQARALGAAGSAALQALDAAPEARALRREWLHATDPDAFSAVALSRVVEQAFAHARGTPPHDAAALAGALAVLAAVSTSVMPGFAADVQQALGLDPRPLDRWLAEAAPVTSRAADVRPREALGAAA